MLIIFDFDGVLRSASWKGLYKAHIALAKYAGKDYRQFFRNMREFKKWWNPDWRKGSKRLGIKDIKENSRIFHKHYGPYAHIFPWVTGTLRRLSKKHTLTLLSAASRASIKKSLASRIKYFKLIVSCEDVEELKPDPEGINLILKKLNVESSKAVIIGDMPVDILAGKSAGIKTWAVKWGLGRWKDLIALKPDDKFKNEKELLTKIKATS